MSFSSRRRNYLLTPHRRDGLIEWMKSMLQHSFVLDALDTTGADTFEHFESLIEEHIFVTAEAAAAATTSTTTTNGERRAVTPPRPSRLQQLVPTVGVFHTPLPLRTAFLVYNQKHRLTKRKHIQISFNEIRHILNLAQIMALRKTEQPAAETVLLASCTTSAKLAYAEPPVDDEAAPAAEVSLVVTVTSNNKSTKDNRSESFGSSIDDLEVDEEGNDVEAQAPPSSESRSVFNGPRLVTFDGDQTLYSDGQNFERNPRLAFYLYQLLRHGVYVAVVTAAGYEYMVEKYEYRLSGLLLYFKTRGLTREECERFYLFGGECNYLLRLGDDYHLHPVPEHDGDNTCSATASTGSESENGDGDHHQHQIHHPNTNRGWMSATKHLRDCPAHWSQENVKQLLDRAAASVEKTLDELNLRGRVIRKYRSVGLVPRPGLEITRESLDEAVLRVHEELSRLNGSMGPKLPYCAFNGGTDAWVDVGNKRVGVQVLQSYLGVRAVETLHIGDQFLNTGNDYAARDVSPCIWIINPQETTYILKSILRLAGVSVALSAQEHSHHGENDSTNKSINDGNSDSSFQSGAARGKSSGNKIQSRRSFIDFKEMERRSQVLTRMDVYTGEMVPGNSNVNSEGSSGNP